VLPCFGSEVGADLAVRFNPRIDPVAAEPGDRWVVVTCFVEWANASWVEAVYRVGDPAIVAVMRRRAEEFLVVPVPRPRLAPPVGVDHLVGVPEFLAVDAAGFVPMSATAAIPGVSVTVTATPVLTRWEFGNGDSRVCGGAGVPWSAGMSVSGACTYTFERASTSPADPDGVFGVTVATVWQRSWSCTPGCGGGVLPQLLRPTGFPLTVRQAQAQITG
jgi:hypothetical protein